MHRLIINAPLGKEVDHINGDSLDNRRDNLRLCTRQQNCCNRKHQIKAKSKYKGVHPRKDKWAAVIRFKKRLRHIGVFETEVAAAMAYDDKARELFGDFAFTNFNKRNKVAI
jgi:hypothetical protein